MSKRKKIDWSSVKDASRKPKRLHLEKDSDEKYHCPIPRCDHEGFTSQRGCRKHVKSKHGWFYYFDVKPDENLVTETWQTSSVQPQNKTRYYTIPSYPVSSAMGESFHNWLTGCGGGKSTRDAKQIVSRTFKFLNCNCRYLSGISFSFICPYEKKDKLEKKRKVSWK